VTRNNANSLEIDNKEKEKILRYKMCDALIDKLSRNAVCVVSIMSRPRVAMWGMGIAKRRQTQYVLNCSCMRMRPAVDVYICMHGLDQTNQCMGWDGGACGEIGRMSGHTHKNTHNRRI
jgi:hypothetical protein